MEHNLADPASTQHNDWRGTVAADQQLTSLGQRLGIDTKRWMVVVVRATVVEHTQFIEAWGVGGTHQDLEEAASRGRIEVTKVLDHREHVDSSDDTSVPKDTITSVTDLVASAFGQFEMLLRWKPEGLRRYEDFVIVEVDSIVENDQ